MIFGKPAGQYLAFQKLPLILTAAVGLARLALSLAGVPNSTVAFLSMNVVLWASAFYYGFAVHRRGFGSYRQILPLVFFQVAVFHGVACLGILLAIIGFDNIFAAPEYSGPATPGNQWLHLLSHLTVGMVLAPLVLWGAASIAMLVAKKLR